MSIVLFSCLIHKNISGVAHGFPYRSMAHAKDSFDPLDFGVEDDTEDVVVEEGVTVKMRTD